MLVKIDGVLKDENAPLTAKEREQLLALAKKVALTEDEKRRAESILDVARHGALIERAMKR